MGTSIKTTPKNLKELKKLGILSVEDLLLYFPRRYLDFSKTKEIRDIKIDEIVTLKVQLKTINARFSFKTRTMLVEAVVQDKTGNLKITWFNMGYLAKTLKNGDMIALAGKVTRYKNIPQMINPMFEKMEGELLHTGRLVPVYKLTPNLYQKTFRKLIHANIQTEVPELIPHFIRQAFTLPDIHTAVKESHYPTDPVKLKAAQRRLIFEELFVQQLAVKENKKLREKQKAPKVFADVEVIKKFLKTLPFELTLGQKQALWTIMQDMDKEIPMNRLLLGDVGSGKTVVAAAAALCVAKAGFQTAFLAPTEILAKQHYDSLCKLFSKTKPKLNILLHTQSSHGKNGTELTLAELKKELQKNKFDLIIGTHALLAKKISLENLGLVIVDEQHRFGVSQRQHLLAQKSIHLLSMSATPIPRTLALSFFGELNVSLLKEMPKNRLPIQTRLCLRDQEYEIHNFIKSQIDEGRQIYWVLPLIDENEEEDITSVKQKYEELQNTTFKKYKIAILHGKMKADDKNATMKSFSEGKIDILVATTVIEIGVDVPNASCMVIEHADRFGLAQLHQLRGRVGRGKWSSYCFAFSDNEDEDTLQRISAFTKESSGFKLAEIDLENRGFGTLFAANEGNKLQQSGFFFKYSKYLTMQVLKESKQAADSFESTAKLGEYPLLHKSVTPLISEIHLE